MPLNFKLNDPKKKITSIQAVVHFKGMRYKIGTGESVNPEFWLNNQRTSIGIKHPDGKKINNRLDEIEKHLKSAEDYFRDKNQIPDFATFKDKFQEFRDGKKPSADITFVEYLKKFISESSFEYETLKKYKTALNKLTAWETYKERILTFDNIDIHFYTDFEKWFYSLLKSGKDKETKESFSSNYFGSIIKVIKKLMNQARADGLTVATGDRHKDFKIPADTADSIYLTIAELEKIHRLEITPQKLAEFYPKISAQNLQRKVDSCLYIRDLFLIGAFTGLRVSDFTRLDDIHFTEKYLTITTKKTNKKVIVPLHKIVRQIIENGFDFTRRISDVKINKQIKQVCKIAGINEAVETTIKRAGKEVRTVSEKWQLVSTHTARRSAATNLYKAGIPSISIMKITGHTTEKSFLKYIKISQEENAELMAEHTFFK
jgi:integrase